MVVRGGSTRTPTRSTSVGHGAADVDAKGRGLSQGGPSGDRRCRRVARVGAAGNGTNECSVELEYKTRCGLADSRGYAIK